MKRSLLLVLLVVLATLPSVSNGAEKGYQKILGVWEFTATNAPQPYGKGTLSLKEVNHQLAGEFTVQGEVLPIQKIGFESEILSLEFEVENTPIILKLKLKEGQFEGKTDTPEGAVSVNAKPAPKK